MEQVIYKEITLPEHECTTGRRICHVCHGDMTPCVVMSTFDLPHKKAKVVVFNIHSHMCEACGESVYSSAEAKLIEEAIDKALSDEG